MQRGEHELPSLKPQGTDLLVLSSLKVISSLPIFPILQSLTHKYVVWITHTPIVKDRQWSSTIVNDAVSGVKKCARLLRKKPTTLPDSL
jgi:hypothetical protein